MANSFRYTHIPDALRHGATGIEAALDDVGGDCDGANSRQIATTLRGHVGHGARLLADLAGFAGRLDVLAWAANVRKRVKDIGDKA